MPSFWQYATKIHRQQFTRPRRPPATSCGIYGWEVATLIVWDTMIPYVKRVLIVCCSRFAAKEAVIKAHPQHNLTYHQIMIERMSKPTTEAHPDQQPEDDPRSSGPPIATILLKGRPPSSAAISISHDGDYAMAVCIGVTGNTAP